ncbi:MAG: ABC transporter, ATP-binding protein (cluster 8, B12/iron complex) [uncultured Rubellimicrobium sp.]|uniref:ABC transporter, ATP-binding protein (Cluster 8, B12/iron complex) n=1 Tax=uncultured Rubellimicrobium sp. TaxID=543078 RepID=A0A6J4P4J5_9RHOB|nr:MAG: ABC transporter, ATP-binding protein (cluster 8, B12/iron complex) [uncultured Rubellimicrobium sp.]
MVTLRLGNVSARYGRRAILSGISTPVFHGGEVVALLGPNAAGKSTLFRRMFGLLKGEGIVRIEGARTERPLGYMPQDNGSNAALTVYEAVLLARMQGRRLSVAPEDLAEVERTLDFLDISALGSRDIGDLSGGQKQLVSAAQAIVQEPEILLLDEPTSALDLHRQIALLSILRRLATERGVLIMAALHDLGHALRFTDRAMVLRGGALVACGDTAEVVTPALLREVWGIDARVEPCSKGHRQIIVDGVA